MRNKLYRIKGTGYFVSSRYYKLLLPYIKMNNIMKKNCLKVYLSVFIFLLAGYYSSAQENMIGWWKFENNAADESGNNHNGVLSGNPVFDNSDYKEGSYSLVLSSSSSQRVDVEYDALKAEFTERTLALWFRATDPSADQILIEEGGTAKGIALRLNENKIQGQANQDGGFTLSVSTDFTSTDWTHVALVFNAGTMTLYVNGEQADQQTNADVSAVGPHGDPATIGGSNWSDAFGGSGYFDGKIDDARIYSAALSAEDVAVLATSGSGAANAKTLALKKLPAASSITIDGDASDWNALSGFEEQTNTKYNLKEGNENLAAPESAEDLTATWKATYDDDGIYLLVNVKDDVVQQPDEPSWYHDVLEAYFKIGKGTATPGDIADDCVNGFFQYSFPLVKKDDHEFGVAQECKDMQAGNADWNITLTDDGYMAELYIAFAGLTDESGVVFDPSGDVPFGFELHVHDNDNTDLAEVNPRTRAYWSLDRQAGSVSGGHAWETAAWETGTTGMLTFSGEELEGGAGTSLTNNLKKLPAASSITIDGDASDWNALSGFEEQTNTKYNLKEGNENLAAPESAEDLTATWKATYDDDGIYLLVNVKDDVVQQPDEPSWYHDVLEAYFKIGKGTATPGDIADDCVNGFFQYSFPLVKKDDHEFGVAQECKDMQAGNADWNITLTDDGYMAELYIAFAGLTDESGVVFDPSGDVPFGFELHVHDNDNTDLAEVNPRTRAYWSLDGQAGSVSGGHAWESGAWETGTTGTFNFTGEELEANLSVITIDGVIESLWDNFEWRTLDRVFGYDELTIDNETDQSGKWKIAWDENNLYVLFDVKDDIFDITGDAAFLNDGVGIYLDIINSKAALYDANHYYIRHVYQQDALSGWQGPLTPNAGNQPPLQCDYAETVVEGEGYVVEFAIPFADLGITPVEGMMLGIDVRSTDRDGEGLRDQIAWNDDTDWLYRDPYRFGTIELIAGGDIKGYNIEPETPVLTVAAENNSISCSWEAVDNAAGYYILKDGEIIEDTKETMYSISLDKGVYEFSLVAYATGNVQSEASEPVTIEITTDQFAGWEDYTWYDISRVISDETVTGPDDLSGRFKLKWDEDNLYVLIDVKDDILDVSEDAPNYARDNTNIYIDATNAKANEYTLEQYNFGHAYTEDVIWGWQGGAPAGSAAYKPPQIFPTESLNPGTGYTTLWTVPFDSINVNPEAGMLLGFDIIINDRDNSESRDFLAFNDDNDLLWRDPYRFGSIKLMEDGSVEAYNFRPEQPVIDVNVNGNSVSVTWDAVTDAVGYLLLQNGEMAVKTTETSATINDLEEDLYEFKLVALGEGEVWSPVSEAVDVEVTASQVSISPVNDLAADVNEGSVTLTWSAVDNAAGYIILQGGEEIGTTEETSYAVTGLTTGDYTYLVIAYTADDIQSAAGNEVSASVTVGISRMDANALFDIYPNPTGDILVVRGNPVEAISIYGIDGRILIMEKYFGNSINPCEMNVSDLQSGIYILVINDGKNLSVSRFVKK